MNETNLKNTIVLKNLPSNLIEEAVIVLKNKKTFKEIEKIEKRSKNKKNTKNSSYVIKEAESVINDYISKIEEKRKNKDMIEKNTNKKIKKLKKYAIFTTIVIAIETILFMIIK